MRTDLPPLLAALLFALPAAAGAVEVSVTVLPNASIQYGAESKHLPDSYVNRFAGQSSPVYRLDIRQDPSPRGYWSLVLTHTGDFGGGGYGEETVPDLGGGTYQTSRLNVGYTDTTVLFRRPFAGAPLEALFGVSVMRGFFTRKEFVIEGEDLRATGFDHRSEISIEGLGFGLSGRHGGRFFLRWQTLFNYYVQLADAETDASYGQVFQAEGGAGIRLPGGLALEAGAHHQYWFVPGPAYRVSAPNDRAAIVAWQRQRTVTRGAYLRLAARWGGPETPP